MSLRDCDCGHWTGCNAKVTDEALIGELVKRGVLKETKNDLGLFLFYALREPVGSVEGTP